MRDDDKTFLEQAVWAIAALKAHAGKRQFDALRQLLSLAEDQARDDFSAIITEQDTAEPAQVVRLKSETDRPG